MLIGWFAECDTATEYEPTRWLATQCKTGAAAEVIGGVAQGMLSTWAALAIVSVAVMLAYGLAGGFSSPALGLYGVGFAAVGMLATLGITLATDAHGPIADPFKDASGPSLNILIKLMSMAAVVFAGVIVKFAALIAAALGIGGQEKCVTMVSM